MLMEETSKYAFLNEENNRQKEKDIVLDCLKGNLEND